MADPKRVRRQPGYASRRNISGSTALASTTSVGAGQVTPPQDTRLQTLGKTQSAIADHFARADQVNQLGQARTDLVSKRMDYLQKIQQDDPNNWRNWEPGYNEMMNASKQEHTSTLPAVLAGEFQKTYTGILETGQGAVSTFARNTQITTTLANFTREEDVYAQSGIYADSSLGREESQAQYAERVQNLVASGFLSPDKAKEQVENFNYKVTEGRINRLVFEDLDQDPIARYEKLKSLHHDITVRARKENTHGLKEDRRTYWERVIWGEMQGAVEADSTRDKIMKERYRHNEEALFIGYEDGIKNGSMLSDADYNRYNDHIQEEIDSNRADIFGSSYGKWSAGKLSEIRSLRKESIGKIKNQTNLVQGISDAVNLGDPKKLSRFMANVPQKKRQNYVDAAYRSAVLKATVRDTDTESLQDVDAYVSAIVDGDTVRMEALESKLAGKYDINNPDVKQAMLGFLDVLPGNHLPRDVVNGLEAGLATAESTASQVGLFRELSPGMKNSLAPEVLTSYEIFDTLLARSNDPESAYAAAVNRNIDARDLKSRREHLENKYKADGGVFGVTEDFLDKQYNQGWWPMDSENPFEDPRHQRVFEQLFLRHYDSIQDKEASLDSAWKQFSANLGDVNGVPMFGAPNVLYGQKSHSKGYTDSWIDADSKATVAEKTGYAGDPDRLMIIRAVTTPVPGHQNASTSNPVYEVLAGDGTEFLGVNGQTFYYRPDYDRYSARKGSQTFGQYTDGIHEQMLQETSAHGNIGGP